MKDLINGKFDDSVDEFHLIDCRYPYEYHGGHITGAVNITTIDLIDKFFTPPSSKKVVIVFHCEYSIQRAPQMYKLLTRALHFRGRDRKLNELEYPKLCYPDLYILKGGYRSFFSAESTKSLCQPLGYIEMNDPKYAKQCREGICLQKKQFRKCFSEGFLN